MQTSLKSFSSISNPTISIFVNFVLTNPDLPYYLFFTTFIFDHSFKTAFKITKNTRSQFSLYPSFCRVHITKQAMRYKGTLF